MDKFGSPFIDRECSTSPACFTIDMDKKEYKAKKVKSEQLEKIKKEIELETTSEIGILESTYSNLSTTSTAYSGGLIVTTLYPLDPLGIKLC